MSIENEVLAADVKVDAPKVETPVVKPKKDKKPGKPKAAKKGDKKNAKKGVVRKANWGPSVLVLGFGSTSVANRLVVEGFSKEQVIAAFTKILGAKTVAEHLPTIKTGVYDGTRYLKEGWSLDHKQSGYSRPAALSGKQIKELRIAAKSLKAPKTKKVKEEVAEEVVTA